MPVRIINPTRYPLEVAGLSIRLPYGYVTVPVLTAELEAARDAGTIKTHYILPGATFTDREYLPAETIADIIANPTDYVGQLAYWTQYDIKVVDTTDFFEYKVVETVDGPRLQDRLQAYVNQATLNLGYDSPIPYTAGIYFGIGDVRKTVEYAGNVYAPILDELPFTTSGTFEATKFRVIQGVTTFDLADDGAADTIGDVAPITNAAPTTVHRRLNRTGWTIDEFDDALSNGGDATDAFTKAFTELGDDGHLFLMAGWVYVVENELVLPFNNFTMSSRLGVANIKAADGTNFDYVLNAAGLANLTLRGLNFNANKAGRLATQTTRLMGLSISGNTDAYLDRVAAGNTLGFGGASAVAINASGGQLRLRAQLEGYDCGVSAVSLPSDFIFLRGTDCHIYNSIARNITDTSFVMEGCNGCKVSNSQSLNSTSAAGITNDTGADCIGNSIVGLIGTSNYVGSTGGLIAVACFGAGSLKRSRIEGVSLSLVDTATNLGAGMQIYNTAAGRVDGLDIINANISKGNTTGKLAQALLVQNSDNVSAINLNADLDTGGGESVVAFTGTCVRGRVINGRLKGGDTSVLASNSSEVKVRDVTFDNPGVNWLNAIDGSTLIENGCTFLGTKTNTKGASALLRTEYYRTIVPVYSTDIGNAAASFDAATTVKAEVSRAGNKTTFDLNMNGVLKAGVAPAYIDIEFGSEFNPADSSGYKPVMLNHAGTWEMGACRPLNGTAKLRVYRQQRGAFSPGVAFEIQGTPVFSSVN